MRAIQFNATNLQASPRSVAIARVPLAKSGRASRARAYRAENATEARRNAPGRTIGSASPCHATGTRLSVAVGALLPALRSAASTFRARRDRYPLNVKPRMIWWASCFGLLSALCSAFSTGHLRRRSVLCSHPGLVGGQLAQHVAAVARQEGHATEPAQQRQELCLVGLLEQGDGVGCGVDAAPRSLLELPRIAPGRVIYAVFRRCCEISCLLCLSNAISDDVSALGACEVRASD